MKIVYRIPWIRRQRSRDREKNDDNKHEAKLHSRLREENPDERRKCRRIKTGCMKPGDKVSTKNMKSRQWTKKATIIGAQQGGVSYEVEINGKRHTRNRRFLRKIARFDDVHTPEIGGADERVCISTKTLDESCIQSNTNNGHGSTQIAKITTSYRQPQPNTVIATHKTKMKWTINPYITASHNEAENRPLTILRKGMATNDKLAWFEDFERCLRINGLTQNNRAGCRIR